MNSDCRTSYKRGDIVAVDFGKPIGSEQGGVRPALITQNDKGNFYSPTVQVAPMTTRQKKQLPTHMDIGTECGLEVNSTVLFEQMRIVDKTRILGYIGHKDMGIAEDVKIAIVFGCGTLVDRTYQHYMTVYKK